VITITRTRI